MDTTLIKDFSAPSELSLRPMPSLKPILSDAYELCPRLIEMIQTNTFLGIEDWGPGASQWSVDDRSLVMSDWQRVLDWLLA
jgi:hypothetical protein